MVRGKKTGRFYNNRFVGADIWSKSYAKIRREAMGADGYTVNTQLIWPMPETAKKNRRPAVIEIMTDGTRAPPFRRDALALPTRYLPKYEKLDRGTSRNSGGTTKLSRAAFRGIVVKS